MLQGIKFDYFSVCVNFGNENQEFCMFIIVYAVVPYFFLKAQLKKLIDCQLADSSRT